MQGNDVGSPMNIDNVDMIPDIAVGRIPASTVREVSRYIRKILTYEKNAFNLDYSYLHGITTECNFWIRKDLVKILRGFE